MKSVKMKRFLLPVVAALFACAASAMAQPDGYREVNILRSATTDALWCVPESGGYDREPAFRETKRETCRAAVEGLAVDYRTERLVFWSAAGDCHLRVKVKAFRSDDERRVRVVTNVIPGGCRAAGHRAGWIVLKKPPSGYRVSVEDAVAERSEEAYDEEFVFPLPPPVVTKRDVSFRTADITDCLPLQGESRWVISTAEHLERALEGRPEGCREAIRSTGLDLNRETLLGASFASGYCERPDGLRISVTKETSTHPRQNAYVLNAIYDDPVEPCKVWRTFPVWVVVAKLEAGYSFEVHARRASRANEPRVPVKKPITWVEG